MVARRVTGVAHNHRVLCCMRLEQPNAREDIRYKCLPVSRGKVSEEKYLLPVVSVCMFYRMGGGLSFSWLLCNEPRVSWNIRRLLYRRSAVGQEHSISGGDIGFNNCGMHDLFKCSKIVETSQSMIK